MILNFQPMVFNVLSALLSNSESGNGTNSVVKDLASDTANGQNQIILALIGIIATSVAALVYTIRNNTLAKAATQTVAEVNKAVNNIGPGEHRLYDKVDDIQKKVDVLQASQEAFDEHGWNHLPADFNDAVSLTSTIRDLQNHRKTTDEKLDRILAELTLIGTELRDHVKWGMRAKYTSKGQ